MTCARDVSLARRLAAEAIGSALLMCTIVAAGTIATRLAVLDGTAIPVATSLAVAGALVALTLAFADVSGAYFNPALTLAAAWMRELDWADTPLYVLAQVIGAMIGVAAAFSVVADPLLTPAGQELFGTQWRRGEFVAAFGLIAVVFSCRRTRPQSMPIVLAGYMMAAVWFTPSGSFANPAVMLARAAMSPPAKIDFAGVGSLLAGQLAGGLIAAFVVRWLVHRRTEPQSNRPLLAVETQDDAPAPARRYGA